MHVQEIYIRLSSNVMMAFVKLIYCERMIQRNLLNQLYAVKVEIT